MPESIEYREGNYRPASYPIHQGYYPHNYYLQAGKVYSWCSCGITSNNPWCDQFCNTLPTRNRPMAFNVDESGYYKICNCKVSANAPFCNGTHRLVMKYHFQSHRGFYEVWGQVLFWGGWIYMFWNFYT
jgi:CDGSH iron-sulfur domain-containing protein 3